MVDIARLLQFLRRQGSGGGIFHVFAAPFDNLDRPAKIRVPGNEYGGFVCALQVQHIHCQRDINPFFNLRTVVIDQAPQNDLKIRDTAQGIQKF